MKNQETNQATPVVSEVDTTETNSAHGAQENNLKEEKTMKSNSLNNVNTNSKENADLINNSTEPASTKSKSQQSDKKKAEAEEKKKAKAEQKAEEKKQAEADKKALAEEKAIAKQKAAEEKAKADQIAIETIVIKINSCLTQAKLHESQAEEIYFDMGKWLCEAKDKVKKLKGVKWLNWLEANFDMTERTAQIRMKTYNAFVNNPKALADLGYTKASILAPLSPDEREAFLPDQQHEVKEGVFKTVQDMTTRELERVIQESKKDKPRPPQQRVSVEGFSKKLSSLGTQLDDVVHSLSTIDGDAAETCKKLYTELCKLLEINASKLTEQPSGPSDNTPSGSDPNPSEEVKA